MTRYRKLPSFAEMIQWHGTNPYEILDWSMNLEATGINNYAVKARVADEVLWLWVRKSENECAVHKGDWVVSERDRDGYYPLAQSEQSSTYVLDT